MTLNDLSNIIPPEKRDDNAIMLFYTKESACELVGHKISDETWTKIMKEIEESDFYEAIYERIQQAAYRVLEAKS